MTAEQQAREQTRLVAKWGGGVLAASVALSAVGWVAAEPGQQAVLHRGADGAPTRVGDITELLVGLPLVAGGMLVLMLAAARWGHHLRHPGQEPTSPRMFAVVLVTCVALIPALQAVMLIDAFGYLAADQIETLLHLFVSVPLIGLGLALRSARLGPRLSGLVNLPQPTDPALRQQLVRAAGTFLAALGGTSLLAGVLAPAWVFVTLIGGGTTVGVVALLAYGLRLQNRESAAGEGDR